MAPEHRCGEHGGEQPGRVEDEELYAQRQQRGPRRLLAALGGQPLDQRLSFLGQWDSKTATY